MIKKTFFLISLIIFLYSFSLAQGEAPKINVVYPKDGQNLTSSDSAFIFGSVTPKSSLKINGQNVEVYPNGAFLAFMKVQPGKFVFELVDSNANGVVLDSVKVSTPSSSSIISKDSLAIEETGMLPDVDMNLRAGDIIQLRFKGTPGGKATFSIEGLVSNLPMAESIVSAEKYWGKQVFGNGDSSIQVQSNGVYTGVYQVKPEDETENADITFHLRMEVKIEVIDSLRGLNGTAAQVLAILRSQTFSGTTTAVDMILSAVAPGKITVRQDLIPQIIEFTDSVQIVRTGPGSGYLLLFQPKGVRAIANGQIGEWVRIKLAPSQEGWVKFASINFLPQGTAIPQSKINLIRTEDKPDKVSVIIPLSQKLPFKIEQDSSGILLSIFGGISNADWVKYNPKDELVNQISWSQLQESIYQLNIKLNQKQQWGYDARYDSLDLVLDINKKPKIKKDLDGLKIAVDAGHSPDNGAVGPTGLAEKEINLHLAYRLKYLLEKHGAKVVMTRGGMEAVELYDRPKRAIENGCNILISIHNNALPDGVNPFINNGVSTYYYQPQSLPLARSIQKELAKRLDIPDYGTYYDSFVLTRPTQLLCVLVECAFIMYPEQEMMLRDDKFKQKVVQGIYRGIKKFILDNEQK